MFGYVRANLSKLNKEDVQEYKAVYCTLCKSLKKYYGATARFLLNYDVTFLTLLRLSSDFENKIIKEEYCPYKCKKCNIICGKDSEFFESASILIILAYEKILDNINDEHFFKKIASYFLKIIYRRKYLKAKKAFPVLAEKIRQNMLNQSKVEKEKNASLDALAHPTADSLGVIFQKKSPDDRLYRLGYSLGRWVYFIDAADDRNKDLKHKSFNAFSDKYNEEKIREILNLSAAEAAQAYKEISKENYNRVVENIINSGTFMVQKRVLEGESIGRTSSFRRKSKCNAGRNKQSI